MRDLLIVSSTMDRLISLQIIFLLLLILFASLFLWIEEPILNLLFRVLAGVFVILTVGIIVYRSMMESKKRQ